MAMTQYWTSLTRTEVSKQIL